MANFKKKKKPKYKFLKVHACPWFCCFEPYKRKPSTSEQRLIDSKESEINDDSFKSDNEDVEMDDTDDES